MTLLTQPLTKLNAVNVCLSSMGEPQVNSLDGVAVDGQMAASLIDETSRTVQAMGWHWNREVHSLSPDVSNELVLPANTLRVDSVNGSKTVNVVQRGVRLFDAENATYQFTSAITVELFVYLEWDELPFPAKQYITARSARLLQQRLLGNGDLAKQISVDENTAWVALQQDDLATADHNVLSGSWSTASILRRGAY